ncbi:MAG: branched-chain amino acid ABC transporter permease [Thermoleophilaceae bacterium]|nr:branched-chain amino acid ABC transporter permease [Thermoleophilaceae bacterium]
MSELLKRHRNLIAAIVVLGLLALVPFAMNPLDTKLDFMIFAVGYTMMALDLNIVVGFAGLLDLGYVAFYAIGAYCIGWFGADFFGAKADGGKGVDFSFGVDAFASDLPGIHLNFVLIVIIAAILAAVLGTLIGLPTLRLRGDYIAIVTLAFGEIVQTIAENGEKIKPLGYKLTNGPTAISPVDQPKLPGVEVFDSAFSIRPYFWLGLVMLAIVLFINFRLRDSRMGRAWIAIREDEVAAASMGVPLVKTKLLAYAAGAAIGGGAGAFLGTYNQAINSNQFEFFFSIFILAMVILGGLGNIWGVVAGAVLLSFIDRYLIPEILNDAPSKVGLDFRLTDVNFAIFGFLLVFVMVLRPEGLFPERRRKVEMTEGVGTDESLFEARA